MSQKLQTVRGTHDLIGADMQRYRRITDTTRDVAALYGFDEISTPMFEFSDVFHRTLGETSDVVSKETYTFEDRGGESLTLRPEFTASIVRAFISNGLTQQLPFKAFYAGPAFRYERPQKGRQRQFHQIGVELLGVAEPHADVEVIACGMQMLEALGLHEGLQLQLNTLGDRASREAYREALVVYFTQHKAVLSEDSRLRLEKNPLRILDSKNESDRALIADAPQMHDYLNAQSKAFWDTLRAGLDALEITYLINDKLVRGLDYYSHTVFEITSDALGAQATVLAGGRYDGLVEMMGGPATAGIGFAAGVERLALILEAQEAELPSVAADYAVMPVNEEAVAEALKVTQHVRSGGKRVELMTKGKLGKRMQKVEKAGVTQVVFVNADGSIEKKDMQTGAQESITLDGL